MINVDFIATLEKGKEYYINKGIFDPKVPLSGTNPRGGRTIRVTDIYLKDKSRIVSKTPWTDAQKMFLSLEAPVVNLMNK